MCSDVGLCPVDVAYFSGPFTGWPAVLLAAAMRYFPDGLAALACFGLIQRDRFYKTRTAFMRNIFLIAKPQVPQGEKGTVEQDEWTATLKNHAFGAVSKARHSRHSMIGEP